MCQFSTSVPWAQILRSGKLILSVWCTYCEIAKSEGWMGTLGRIKIDSVSRELPICHWFFFLKTWTWVGILYDTWGKEADYTLLWTCIVFCAKTEAKSLEERFPQRFSINRFIENRLFKRWPRFPESNQKVTYYLLTFFIIFNFFQ